MSETFSKISLNFAGGSRYDKISSIGILKFFILSHPVVRLPSLRTPVRPTPSPTRSKKSMSTSSMGHSRTATRTGAPWSCATIFFLCDVFVGLSKKVDQRRKIESQLSYSELNNEEAGKQRK